MTAMYTTGEWVAKEGHEAAFVEAWGAFAVWANSKPGAGALRLAEDLEIPGRFVSFGLWDTAESAHQWKSDPEFPARMAKVQEHVAQFKPSELQLVRTVDAPAAATG